MFKFNDDDLIINTPRYEEYQQLFSEAGKLAVMENRRLGIPIVYGNEKNEVIKEYPDGRKEVLGTFPPDVVYNGPSVIELKDD
jgi:hypothetical protein